MSTTAKTTTATLYKLELQRSDTPAVRSYKVIHLFARKVEVVARRDFQSVRNFR